MRHPSSVLPLILILAVGTVSSACSRSQPTLGPESRLGKDAGDYGRGGRNGSGYGNGSSNGRHAAGSQQEFKSTGDDTVYFSSDSTDLTPEAQRSLQGQAQWLKRYPNNTITIEGHADERGTREYNIALGAKRGDTVKRYLVSLGIETARIRSTSYGKERPVAVCNDISCWSQNRRAQTVLNAATAVSGRN